MLNLNSSQNLNKPIIIFFASTFFFYFIFFIYINNYQLGNSNFPYYSWLLDAFLNRRLDVIPTTNIDLSLLNNKWYLNWGPAAVFYVLPFKLILGTLLSDKIYTFFAGIFNIVVFYFLLREFTYYFRVKLNDFYLFLILLFFSFASPNFYLSMGGRIWLTEQIVAVLFLMLSLLCLFRFLNKSKNYLFIFSVFFFNLAWLTRAPIVFYGFLFLGVILNLKKDKRFFKLFTSFILFTLTALLLFFSYNYFRFGNIFDTGLIHHLGNPRYQEVLSKRQIFSPTFIPYNFYYFFLNLPQISFKPLSLNINLEGGSIFIFYPLTLLLALFFKKYFYLSRKNLIIKTFFITIFSEVVLLLNYFATGWTQVGYRYFFDLIPLAFPMSVFVIEKFNKVALIILLIIGSLLNICGAVIFFKT